MNCKREFYELCDCFDYDIESIANALMGAGLMLNTNKNLNKQYIMKAIEESKVDKLSKNGLCYATICLDMKHTELMKYRVSRLI
jgi:hypothetical protein